MRVLHGRSIMERTLSCLHELMSFNRHDFCQPQWNRGHSAGGGSNGFRGGHPRQGGDASLSGFGKLLRRKQ